MQTAHCYSRSIRSVRWDLDNLFLLCAGCHMNVAHKKPLEFRDFVLKVLGETKFQALMLRSHNTGKVDLNMVKFYLEQELKKVENEQIGS